MRAITNAAALELRPHGIQVTLLIVDAGIQPLTGDIRTGVAPDALAYPHQIADAVEFLANQGARAATPSCKSPRSPKPGRPEREKFIGRFMFRGRGNAPPQATRRRHRREPHR